MKMEQSSMIDIPITKQHSVKLLIDLVNKAGQCHVKKEKIIIHHGHDASSDCD